MADRGILLVEDSPEDAEAIVRALKQAGLEQPVTHIPDGDRAIRFFDTIRSGDAGRPALILLDLNMPGTDGREVLKRLKSAEDTADIPVLVFTSSSRERDIEDSYQAGANSFLQKPVDYESLLKTAEAVMEYWFRTVLIPPPKGLRP